MLLNFHVLHDGKTSMISFQKGGHPWPTAHNRNFTEDTPRAHEGETISDHPCSSGPHEHWVFPWIHVHHAGTVVFPATHLFPAFKSSTHQRFHPVIANTSYRMWSIVSSQSGGLVERDPSNNNVNCKGAFSDTSGNTEITTSDIIRDCVSLLFKDPTSSKEYVMTAQRDDRGKINIEAVAISSGPPYPATATFVPHYYWSYTMFQNKYYNKRYLGCDNTGNTTLIEMPSLNYPNPQALFILNKV